MSKNWLISYPKSGSNLIRYCIEFLTKKPTQGLKRLYPSNDTNKLILFRSHDPTEENHEEINENDNLIFLIRNYQELILRPQPIFNDIGTITRNYKRLLDFYSSFGGNKIILYYEDLLKDFNFIDTIVTHYKLNVIEDINKFKKNENYHRERSLAVGNTSYSKGKNINFYVENKKINRVSLIKNEKYFKSGVGENYYDSIFKRYEI